jgi:hypothetical protein
MIENIPTADESLAYCRSMRNRRRLKLPSQTPESELVKLKAWISNPSSSMLLAQGRGVRTSSLDFAADFLDTVLESDIPVIWALPSTIGNEGPTLSVIEILQSLIMRALKLDSAVVSEGVNPISPRHFKSTKTIEQWFELFQRCLASFSRLFLVIDMSLVERAVNQEDAESEFFKVSDFVEKTQQLVDQRRKGGLKVIFISWRFNAIPSLEAGSVFDEMQIFTDRGLKAERLMRKPKYRAAFRRRNERWPEKLRSALRVSNVDQN